MQQKFFFILLISTVLLTAWGAAAFGPPTGDSRFGTKQLQMMQTILDLTDEQSAAVQKVLTETRNNISMIIKNSDLQKKDMQVLRTLAGRFKEEGQKQLATVLSDQEIEAMRDKLFAENTHTFILLPAAEKQAWLQDTVGLDAERADKVTAILEQKKLQHEQVLVNLGYDTKQVVQLRQELLVQQQDVKKRLQEILSLEQMDRFEKISRRMRLTGRGPFGQFEAGS